MHSFFDAGVFKIQSKEILHKLYHYNHRLENWNPPASDAPSNSTSRKSLHQWGGPLMRRALQAIYTLAFLCLLRSDEVLKIQSSHIQFVKEEDTEYMVITLPFCKTHQDGRVWACFILIFFRANNLRCQTFSRFISTPWMRMRLTCAQFVPWRNGSKQVT